MIGRFALCVLFAPALVFGQSTLYGQLTGVVRDSQGGVLPGASVTLFGDDVLGERGAVTELDGRYVLRALSPGRYNLRFELAGFESHEHRDIVVTAGTTISIHAELPLAGVSESVVVTGQSPTVDVKTTRLGGTFDLTISPSFRTSRARRTCGR